MTSISFDDLPQDILIQINDLCNEFEERWSGQSPAAIESLVAKVKVRYQPLLAAELIALDTELRHDAGQHVVPSDYASRFPQLDVAMLSVIVSSAINNDAARPDRGTDSDSLMRGGVSDDIGDNEFLNSGDSLSSLRHQLVAAAICSDSEITQMIDTKSIDEHRDDRTLIVDALHNDSRLTDYQADILAGRATGVLSLGEYTLLEQLGAGGMGTVFKAVHRRMHRIVALKILKSDYQRNRRFRERFQREVFAAARLSHPGIVTAFDAGESEGIPYLVSEYVPAHDLGQIVKDSGPLSVAQAVGVLRQTAEALEYAHQQGVIHRDVKPGNLLLDHSGTVQVLDVGLSRLVQDSAALIDDRPDITNTGFVMGTAEYMAPEQAMDGRSADERSDVYSLGCTLYTVLTGKPCYPGDTPVARMLAHRDEPVPGLTAVRSDVPDWLNEVFQKMVAKAPTDRFQSMTEVVRAMPPEQAAIQDHEGPQLHNGRAAGPAWSTVVLVVVALIAIPLVGWIGGFFKATSEAEPVLVQNDEGEAGTSNQDTQNLPGVAADTPQTAIAPFSAAEAREFQTSWAEHLGIEASFVDEVTGIEFVLIPPGSFMMGSTDDEIVRVLTSEVIEDPMKRCSFRSEAPQRSMDIERPFYIARTETTNAQFSRFVEQAGYTTTAETERIGYGMRNDTFNFAAPGEQPFHWNHYGDFLTSDNGPVGNLTWVDTTAFCRHYNKDQKAGYYRLPFEREWEFACRAGSATTWCFGDDLDELRRYAVYREIGRSGHRRAEDVGQRKANAFGLYDMHGNLGEWCDDVFEWRDEELMLEAFSAPSEFPSNQGRYGVVRGGSVNSLVATTRSAARVAYNRFNHCTSFRVVLEIPEPHE